jgi:hypothetical protein
MGPAIRRETRRRRREKKRGEPEREKWSRGHALSIGFANRKGKTPRQTARL